MDSDSESYGAEFELDPADRDASFEDAMNPEEEEKLRLIKTQHRQQWIVRLQFKQNGDEREGNGFYVNMPHPTHHVIFTAGHNLVGVKPRDLVICPTPETATPSTLKCYVSSVYLRKYTEEQERQNKSTAKQKKSNIVTQEQEENDFGVILVEKSPRQPYLGFGFALKLGHDALDKVHLDLIGCKEADDNSCDNDENQLPGQKGPNLDTVTSDGDCIKCLSNQLEYEMETEKGLSGAPVIMTHKNHDTAVAIHNYGPWNERKSRGTRINEKLLDEIYGWIQIGFYNRALQASMTNTIPFGERLYLVFTADSDRAVVRLGYDQETVTKFDILPAYAPPSTYGFPNDFRYVFRLNSPMGRQLEKRWVFWNAVRQTVSLTGTLRDFCFVSLLEDKVRKPGDLEKRVNEKVYYIHVEIQNDQKESIELQELRLRAADLTESDLVLDSLETSEVFFERHKRGKYLYGKVPCMPRILYKPANKREEFDFNLFRFYSG